MLIRILCNICAAVRSPAVKRIIETLQMCIFQIMVNPTFIVCARIAGQIRSRICLPRRLHPVPAGGFFFSRQLPIGSVEAVVIAVAAFPAGLIERVAAGAACGQRGIPRAEIVVADAGGNFQAVGQVGHAGEQAAQVEQVFGIGDPALFAQPFALVVGGKGHVQAWVQAEAVAEVEAGAGDAGFLLGIAQHSEFAVVVGVDGEDFFAGFGKEAGKRAEEGGGRAVQIVAA